MAIGGFRLFQRLAIAILVMVVIIVGLPLAVYHTSVQPGAWIVKRAFESGPLVKAGPGVPLQRDTVTRQLDIPITVENAPDASLDVYMRTDPVADTPSPLVLWIHGGGFISGDSQQVAGYATILADAGYVVASLDSSLAPGTTYPAPVRQANAALAHLIANAGEFGLDPTRVFVGGDSAGAQIASQVAAVETNPALAADMGLNPALAPGTLRGAVLFCGLYDMGTVADTHFPALRTILWSYTGHRDWMRFPDIDQLSTTGNVTPDYPPTFLSVGDADPFASQSHELESALAAQGVPVTTMFWTDARLGHEYQFDFRQEEAHETLEQTLRFLETRSGEGE